MNYGATIKVNVDDYIIRALKEDITSEDVTTNAILRTSRQGKAELICKEQGIVAGLDVFCRVFEILDPTVVFQTDCHDGDPVKKGDLLGAITGDMRVILSGERTALNYLQRMSGIATLTRSYADALAGCRTKLVDTRKTTPNMRPFEKYAVRMGGGSNHRYNLSDGVMIKDNHIGAAGGVKEAVLLAKEYAPFVRKIEVEVENLEMLDQALEAGADIIMLDNMDDETMKAAVAKVNGKAETEASGNISLERIRRIAELGVDYISIGALTHSAPILDISLKNLQPI